MSCIPRARSWASVAGELSDSVICKATVSSFGSLHGVPADFCFQQSYKAITSGRNLDSRSACSLSAGFADLTGRDPPASTSTDIAVVESGDRGGVAVGGTAGIPMATGPLVLRVL